MRKTAPWRAVPRLAVVALLGGLLSLGACTVGADPGTGDSGLSSAPSSDSGPESAPDFPEPPRHSDLAPNVRDDAAGKPAPTFVRDPDLGDVTRAATGGTDLSSAEQFAFTATQFLLDTRNADTPESTLDQLIDDDTTKKVVTHAFESTERGYEEKFLPEHGGWVRSQWKDKTQGLAQSEFMVRREWKLPPIGPTETWMVFRVEIQRTGDQWMLTGFGGVVTEEQYELTPRLKKSLLKDESTWRVIPPPK